MDETPAGKKEDGEQDLLRFFPAGVNRRPGMIVESFYDHGCICFVVAVWLSKHDTVVVMMLLRSSAAAPLTERALSGYYRSVPAP